MKKYRLKINYSEITEENYYVVANLLDKNMNGKECVAMGAPHTIYMFDTLEHWTLTDIPKSWLIEIKEVLSFEEWNKSQGLPTFKSDSYDSEVTHDREMTWNAAIENYKLSEDDKVKEALEIVSELFDKLPSDEI